MGEAAECEVQPSHLEGREGEGSAVRGGADRVRGGPAGEGGDHVAPGPGVPAHRVQLARALAEGLVAAIAASDAKGARLALEMLGQLVDASR